MSIQANPTNPTDKPSKKSSKLPAWLGSRRAPAVLVVVIVSAIGAYFIISSLAATTSGTLSLAGPTSSVNVGDNFTVAVHEDSGTCDAVNGVQAKLTYPSNLQYVSTDFSASPFDLHPTSTGGGGNVTMVVATTSTYVAGTITQSGNTITGTGTNFDSSMIGKTITYSDCSTATITGVDGTDPQHVITVDQSKNITSPTSFAIGAIKGDQVVGVITFKALAAGAADIKFGCINGSGCSDGNAILRDGDSVNLLTTQNDATYTVAGGSVADTTPPSVPTGLSLAGHTQTSLDLTWTASTDDVGVTGYKVYRDGTQVGTAPTPSFTDSGLTPSTTYTYTVAAYDAAGNDSAQSAGLQATTDSNGGQNVGGGGTQPSTATLYLSPASQSVASGSNLTLNVMLDTGGDSINGVQTTITYPSDKFSYVSLVGDSAFGAFPSPSLSSGSVNFSAGAMTAITGVHTVATLTLHALNAGSGGIALQSICTGTSSSTCSAVTYTTTVLNQDVVHNVLNTITGGTYTVTGTTSGGGSGSGSGSSGSSGGSSTGSTGGSSGKTSTNRRSSGASTPGTIPAGGTSTIPANSTVPSTSTNPSFGLTNLQITNITDTSATITWQTNLPATSEVDYGTYPHFGLVAQDANFVTNHSITLAAPNITKGATYAIQVVSRDSAGDAVTSDSEQFSTPGFEVTLKLVDSQGKPLSHASVTLGGQTKTTDANGQVVFENVLAGDQQVSVKAGNKTTKLSIKVGVYDPATKSYKPQQFSLTANRGANSTPYVVAGLVVAAVVVVLLLLPQLGAGRHWVPTAVKNVDMDLHGVTVGGNSAPSQHASQKPTATPSSKANDKKPGPPPGSIIGPGK